MALGGFCVFATNLLLIFFNGLFFMPGQHHLVKAYGIQPPEEQFYPSGTLRLYQRECLPGFEELVG